LIDRDRDIRRRGERDRDVRRQKGTGTYGERKGQGHSETERTWTYGDRKGQGHTVLDRDGDRDIQIQTEKKDYAAPFSKVASMKQVDNRA